MNAPGPEELSKLSMLDLFRLEAENQTGILTSGLLELEQVAGPAQFEALMRAAHSLKGAARIANLPSAVRLAHAMEDCFVAAQSGRIKLGESQIDLLLGAVDLLSGLARESETGLEHWAASNAAPVQDLLESLAALVCASPAAPRDGAAPAADLAQLEGEAAEPAPGPPQLQEVFPFEAAAEALAIRRVEPPERVLRLTAENLNRLLGLAGESLVESRWLRPFADSLQRLKRYHIDFTQQLGLLRQSLQDDRLSDRASAYLNDLLRNVADSQQFLAERVQELDMFDRRSAHLSQRLYLEVLRTRMRPFSDGVRRFPRMVRDLARSLGKLVKLEISGENTQVDRDILERLETPLAHLLRNAVDHGCEPPEARRASGKAPEAVIRLEARHSAGVLLVTVSDDGEGVDLERVRAAAIARRLVDAPAAEKLSESDLLNFLFLPGFTLKDTVTEISGRGFGLDVVQNMVKSVRGSVRLNNQPGRGLRMQLQLPLTLSVLRALLVEVAGEPYAIPLNQITRAIKVPRARIRVLEGRPSFSFAGQQVGLLAAHQILDCGGAPPPGLELPVVVLSDRTSRYGIVVDRFLGQRELVVQPLDQRLGAVRDISSAALAEDGAPVLIINIEDVFQSIDQLLAQGVQANGDASAAFELSIRKPRRILAVDDSLAVRELERKLLTSRGYVAEVAENGVEAWNAVRSGEYDLVITDVEMPHMDGIELASRIKKDPRLKTLPVLILSYKDREEDRRRGLEAGADAYLTKSSFHDEKLLQAVANLMGEPAR